MQAFCRSARYFGASFLCLSISAATHGQIWFSINDVGARSDDRQLESRLMERGSIDFAQSALREATDALSRQFDVPIVLASKKLEEAGVSIDTPITIKLQSLPLESLLRHILSELELCFTVRDKVILITTPEDVESHLDTRVYPVLDLVTHRSFASKDAPPSSSTDYDSLLTLITTTIEPQTWDDVGGPGSLDALDNAGALVVSQTRDVHRKIESLLGSLRLAKTLQGIPSLPVPTFTSQRISSRSNSRTAKRSSPPPAQAWQLPQVHSEK